MINYYLLYIIYIYIIIYYYLLFNGASSTAQVIWHKMLRMPTSGKQIGNGQRWFTYLEVKTISIGMVGNITKM